MPRTILLKYVKMGYIQFNSNKDLKITSLVANVLMPDAKPAGWRLEALFLYAMIVRMAYS